MSSPITKPAWAGNYVFYITSLRGTVIKLDIRVANYTGQEELCRKQADREFDILRGEMPTEIKVEMCLNGVTIREE